MEELEEIESLCPICFQEGKIHKIDGKLIEKNNRVWLVKKCEDHGHFEDLYFSDITVYRKWMKYKGTGVASPDVRTSLFDGPLLYPQHMAPVILANLVVTNRCTSRGSCYITDAEAAGYVYEPSLNELKTLMRQAREARPAGCTALQITGGEPTLRKDLFEIIRLAKEMRFSFVQVATNGIKLMENVEYCRRLKEEGIDTIYLQFDGVHEKINPLVEECKKAIKNLSRVNLKVVLVSTIWADKNIQEAGKIIRFALQNMDIIRGINFQLISHHHNRTNMSRGDRKRQQVDPVKLMDVIEDEFNGQITRDDFLPASAGVSFTKLIEILTRQPSSMEFATHPACSVVTYLFVEDGRVLPVTRFIDAEALFRFIDEQSAKKGPLKRLRIPAALIKNINNFINEDTAPEGFNLKELIKDALSRRRPDHPQRFRHSKSLLVKLMWFQDAGAGNLTMDRLQRCVIHYTTFEGLIPFCTYNGLGYGSQIRKKYSTPTKKGDAKTGKKPKKSHRSKIT